MSIEAVAPLGLNTAAAVTAPAASESASALGWLPGAGADPAYGTSFDNILTSLEQLNVGLLRGESGIAKLAAGSVDSPHRAVIGVEQTRLTFELMLAVRNKILDAYQEVMRMQV